MRMSEFLLENVEPILMEWEEFARSLQPERVERTVEVLRDHAREMIVYIAKDMETTQSADEQQVKSRGRREREQLNVDSAAETHGGQRLEQGFTLAEIVSEYRAIRACVIKLWTHEMNIADRSNLDELTRFNESVDESLTESVTRYTARIAQERNLLLGALGHDLRNPLGAVMNSAQILTAESAPQSARERAVTRIISSGRRMAAMIADLLDFARTQLGEHLPIATGPMSMREACQLAIDEIAVVHPHRPFEFESEGVFLGNWDGARISQMLSNLIGNAAEHGTLGTPIRVRCSESDGHVNIEIHNQGPPIPEHERHRIFDPLARGRSEMREMPHRGSNLGLGLYISCVIATAHGGKIELASSDETGTTFIVRLPRERALL